MVGQRYPSIGIMSPAMGVVVYDQTVGMRGLYIREVSQDRGKVRVVYCIRATCLTCRGP